MFTLVGHSSTTFDATIAVVIMKTEFSIFIVKLSLQPLVTPTITSAKDNISTVLIVPLLVAWQVMRETFTVSSLPNELLQ
jgi:hypothetical protein